jgi:hypothetical protein
LFTLSEPWFQVVFPISNSIQFNSKRIKIMLTNVTAAIVSEVTGLSKTDSSSFIRALVNNGKGNVSGMRKNLAKDETGAFVIVRGRPTVTFDLDNDCMVAAIGSEKTAKVADLSATAHSDYVRNIAYAEQLASEKKAKLAKAIKLKGLEAKLAAVRSGDSVSVDPETVF